MKKNIHVLSMLMAGLMVLGTTGVSYAGGGVVSGFADIKYFVTDEARDPVGGGRTNALENKFIADAEIDFEKTEGKVTLRIDLDFPEVRSSDATNTVLGEGNTFSDHIEQAKFTWAITDQSAGNLALEGGIFNTPIGFEAQDAPDRLQITNGQLFGLLPLNHAGVYLTGGVGPVAVGFLYVDDWNGLAPETNSFGGTLSVTPIPEIGLSVGYIGSDAPNGGAGDTLDVILSGMAMPSSALELTYALEFVKNNATEGYGVVAAAIHENHGLTLRYDNTDTTGGAKKPESYTVAAHIDVESNLTIRAEYKRTDGVAESPSSRGGKKNDLVMAQFLVTF